MAVALGTNAGFVTTAPTADPGGSVMLMDNRVSAIGDIAPAGAVTVTEIGWWCDTATEEANFEVGIYTDDSGNVRPNTLVAGSSATNAKGTGAGWKVVTGLNISITAGTKYWISVQLDDTATATYSDRSATTTAVRYKTASTLPTTWGADSSLANNISAFYAVYSAGGGGNNLAWVLAGNKASLAGVGGLAG